MDSERVITYSRIGCIMNVMTAAIDSFVETARGYAERVDSNIADRENDFRSMCFWNIHNRAVMTREIVGFYMGLLEKVDDDPVLRAEILERVVTVTRDMFVDTVSSIEKASKDCLWAYRESSLKEKALNGGSHLYLRNIMTVSAEEGLMDEDESCDWDNILLMRNLVTHNNSAGDRSKMFKVDDVGFSMRPNRMMKGGMCSFVVLTRRITELFYLWLEAMDSRHAEV